MGTPELGEDNSDGRRLELGGDPISKEVGAMLISGA